MSEKDNQRKRVFLVNKTRLYRQSCKCVQLLHNYMERDLGNPNFSSTTIVIALFS